MSVESFQSVIGNAVIDTEFRRGLLNGKRRFILSNFNLSPEEVEFAMKISANSLEDFAGQLDSWISRARGAIEPPPLAPILGRVRPVAPHAYTSFDPLDPQRGDK